jgi:hypothetical protein
VYVSVHAKQYNSASVKKYTDVAARDVSSYPLLFLLIDAFRWADPPSKESYVMSKGLIKLLPHRNNP